MEPCDSTIAQLSGRFVHPADKRLLADVARLLADRGEGTVTFFAAATGRPLHGARVVLALLVEHRLAERIGVDGYAARPELRRLVDERSAH